MTATIVEVFGKAPGAAADLRRLARAGAGACVGAAASVILEARDASVAS